MTNESSPLHVLMILDAAYPPPLGGGTEMQVRTLAAALRVRGHRVTVLAELIDKRSQKSIGRVDRSPVCRLRYPRIRLIGGLWLMLRLAGFLWARRSRYDAWHVHSPRRLGAVAALVGHFLVKPRVVVKVASATEFERGTLSGQPNLLNRLLYHCLRRADAWQAISQRIAGGLVARGIPRERVASIPNAVDTNRFQYLRHASVNRMRFLFLGRMVPAKDLFVLLHAFSELLLQRPQASLRLVGGGPLEGELKQLAQTLGIADRVDFAGYRTDVESVIAEADIGVLPSVVEGLSNTLLECMACGLPMVASRVSGSEDVVIPGSNGWLFAPGNRAELVGCLMLAADMPSIELRAYGDEARSTIERYASLASVVERMICLYRRKVALGGVAASTANEGA